jgi:hypothetical protein
MRILSCKPLIAFTCFTALCAALVINSLALELNQDEEQFVTAAYLAQHMRRYADFLYLQLPIYPLILSKLLMLFSGASAFLVARLLSAALAIGAVVVFFSLAARLAESTKFAFMLASLFASMRLMLWAYGLTRNDIMPIFFGLCGVWFVLCGLDLECKGPGRFWALFFGGICMALSVGAKVNAAFIPLSAMLYIFLRAKPQLLPLVLGGAVGSLPIVYCAATAFDNFLYCSVVFHFTERQEYYTDIGQAEVLTWPYRIKRMALLWAGEPTLVVASLFVVFVVFIGWRRRLLFRTIAKHPLADGVFIILLVFVAIPFVFLPYPFDWPYLQPAVPYVLLSCATLYPLAQRILERPQILMFVAMAVVVLVLQLEQFVAELLSRPVWMVGQVHDLSALIARYVKGGAVATIYPALVLDVGTPIYPEFASSPFFFRAADHLAPERVLELKGVSPRTLPLVLATKPPAAVFAGNTGDDMPLLNWARNNCYVEVDLAEWQGGLYDRKWKPRLFLRPYERGPCGG